MHIHVPESYEMATQIPAAESAVNLNFRHAGSYVIFEVEGPLTFRWVAEEICAEVRHMIEGGRKKLVIDLAGVPFVDSAGVGALAATLNLIRTAGGNLVLLSTHPRVREMLKRLRLDRLFTFSNDRTLAFTRQ